MCVCARSVRDFSSLLLSFCTQLHLEWLSLHSSSLMLSLDDRPGFTINANIQLCNRDQLIYDDSKNGTNEAIALELGATWKFHSMWWKVLISRCRCQLLFAYECEQHEVWHNFSFANSSALSKFPSFLKFSDGFLLLGYCFANIFIAKMVISLLFACQVVYDSIFIYSFTKLPSSLMLKIEVWMSGIRLNGNRAFFLVGASELRNVENDWKISFLTINISLTFGNQKFKCYKYKTYLIVQFLSLAVRFFAISLTFISCSRDFAPI